MSLSAAVLDALVKAGATREQLVAAMQADIAEREAEEAAKLEKKRRGNRERQERKRERDRNAESRVTAVTKRDARDNPSPNERDNLTPTRETKTEPKGSSKSLIEEEKQRAIGSCLKVAYPAPDGVTDPVWRDFLNSPKRRKAGMSATAYSGIVRNLAELAEHGFPPGEMIVLAVERGWVTVKLEWVLNDNDRRTHTMGRHQPADGLSATTRAAVKVFGPG